MASSINSIHTRVSDWMHERKTSLNKNIVKVKQLAVNNKTPQQEIHFEFYTVLPNMRIPVPYAEKPVSTVRTVSAMSNNVSVMTNTNNAIALPKVTALFDAGQLQNALKEELNQDQPETKTEN